jgi:hypothetical protein
MAEQQVIAVPKHSEEFARVEHLLQVRAARSEWRTRKHTELALSPCFAHAPSP